MNDEKAARLLGQLPSALGLRRTKYQVAHEIDQSRVAFARQLSELLKEYQEYNSLNLKPQKNNNDFKAFARWLKEYR